MSRNKSLLSRFVADERGSMVADVGKAAAVICVLSVVAAHVISRQMEKTERGALAEIASLAASGRNVDPITTGSILDRARGVSLDPCVDQTRR